jgi:hypothetical protein
LDSLTGIAFIGSTALLGYDLRTSFGPRTASPGGVGYPTGHFVHTTLGDLSFTSDFSPTTRGTSAANVPEPSTLALMGLGVLAVFRKARRRV